MTQFSNIVFSYNISLNKRNIKIIVENANKMLNFYLKETYLLQLYGVKGLIIFKKKSDNKSIKTVFILE